MPARIGKEHDLFATPFPELLHGIGGIEPEAAGNHVRLDRHAGVRSTQRLALGQLDGGVVAGLYPAELKPRARYLYAEGRAGRLIAAASDLDWWVEPQPHLALHTAPPSRRLYLETKVSVDACARRWESTDGEWVRQYSAAEVRRVLWPWLRERGYATAVDDAILEDFLAMLGRRGAHLRPGLRLTPRVGPRRSPSTRRLPPTRL